MAPTKDKRAWIERQAVDAVERAITRLGDGRKFLSPEVFEAFVCREVVVVLTAQDDSLREKPVGTWIDLASRALALAGEEGAYMAEFSAFQRNKAK